MDIDKCLIYECEETMYFRTDSNADILLVCSNGHKFKCEQIEKVSETLADIKKIFLSNFKKE